MRENHRFNTYSPQRTKGFRTALKLHRGGVPKIWGTKGYRVLFLDELTKLADYFYPKAEYLRPGELPWIGVAKEKKPSYGKGMDKTKTEMGILPLVSEDDILMLEKDVPFKEVVKSRRLVSSLMQTLSMVSRSLRQN